MFQKDDYILYRTTGICRIADIGMPPDFSATAPDTLYYYLAPVHGSGIIYVPVDSPVYMRSVISREEAEQLLSSIPTVPESPLLSRDQKELTSHYKALLQNHDCISLIQLIKETRKKADLLSTTGKSLGKIDVQYRKQAEDLLEQELSVALNIPYEEVSAYIWARA